jgi:energy-coupling factor transporter ATP-binding protein EcfA2
MSRFFRIWEQGQHVVVSGSTGSGKTALGRHIDQVRIERGGHVIVFVCKLQRDLTILNDYKGFIRWNKMKKNPSPHENAVLLWPDTSKGKTLRDKREIQREAFGHALDVIGDTGKWCLDIDEGLYMCHRSYMGLEDEVAMLHALGRSSGLTIVTKMQRPSNVPLIIYGSASHGFIGRTRERADLQRLAEMGGKASAKELQTRISALGRHDFMWLPVAEDWEPEVTNLRN